MVVLVGLLIKCEECVTVYKMFYVQLKHTQNDIVIQTNII